MRWVVLLPELTLAEMRMKRQAVRQVGLESECLETAGTAKPLGAGVCLDVRSKVGTVGERLSTEGAGERFLSGMRSLVAAQKPRPRERLVARRAAVLEVVGKEVHRQGWHRHVDLAAVRTRPRVFAVDAAVGLLVTAEIRRGRVAPVALVARVLGPRCRSSCRRRRTDRR